MMKDFQPLNLEQHKHLGYAEEYGAAYGHQVGAVMILPNEFARVQREYPILFRKEAKTGRFLPVALLGFAEQENLFLNDNSQWSTNYIPLAMRQGPFMITLQQQGTEKKWVVCVDVNDARVTQTGAPALFNADGTSTPTLNNIRDILFARHEGAGLLDGLIETFLKYDLLEPVMLEISLANGETLHFDAGYTVHIEKLIALENDAVVELHKSGYLSLAYNVADSVNNIQRLIDIKNARMQ